MILENGIVKYLTVEDNAQKTSCTMAGHVLEALGKCFRKSQCATLFCLSYYDPMHPQHLIWTSPKGFLNLTFWEQ